MNADATIKAWWHDGGMDGGSAILGRAGNKSSSVLMCYRKDRIEAENQDHLDLDLDLMP